MISLKIRITSILLFTFFTFSFSNCSSKKAVTSNKEFVLEANKIVHEEQKSNILYIMDGKEINQAYMKTLNPNNIKSIDVIKGKENMKKYTLKTYDGIIIIHLKK